jgi:phospholipid/cholesterol/gamma-HCH transport system permease protein
MISISKTDKTLTIKDFPERGMSLEEIQDSYDKVKISFTNDISDVNIELDKVLPNDYSTLAFLKSCGNLFSGKGVKVSFSSLEGKMAESIESLGFDNSGGYSSENLRKSAPKPILIAIGEASIKLYNDSKKLAFFSYELLLTFAYFFRHPNRINFKEMLYYIDQTGADAVPIVSLICFLIGVILAFQGISQMKVFGLEVYVADLVGLSIVRELGPLMVAMICTGRAGSAFAAELGTMKVSEEIDAIKTMGLKPIRVLIVPKILGLMAVMPFLTIIGDFIGVVGGGVMTSLVSEISMRSYFARVFESLTIPNVFESIVKSIVFAFLVAAIGCFRGIECENDAKGVGNATTSSVVSGIFLIILADTLVTFVYPQFMHLIGISY